LVFYQPVRVFFVLRIRGSFSGTVGNANDNS
jgi:hypothetical protein